MRNNTDRGIFKLTDKVVDLLFPRRCPVCDNIVPLGEGLVCRDCIPKIRYVKEPRCRICGKQLLDDSQMLCRDCTEKKHKYDYGYALYEYKSMKMSLYRFKYKKRCEYAKFYARDIYYHLGKEISSIQADAIIPIPLHKTKMRERGYNQAELVANELSKYTGIPVHTKIVKRIRKTVPQKQLDSRGRQNNLKKAFIITSDVVKLNKIILIDDIYTTGSTIDAVSDAFRQCGTETVVYIALSIGEGV